MWCSNCQQDMPGFAHATSGRIVCSRCHQPMRTKKATHATGICDGGIALDETATATACAGPPKLDDWQMRQRTRLLGRELRRPGAASSRSFEQVPDNPRRFDPPADLLDNSVSEATPIAITNNRASAGGQLVAWLIVAVGILALCGGLSGIIWSIAAERGDYWNQALGLTLAGQGALIFGLVLVVARLWRNSRYATSKLQEVYQRLVQLSRSPNGPSANRPTAAVFYADIARGLG
jgi:hypothetical protein